MGKIPDIIWDKGSIGKEPMIRLFSRTSKDMIQKLKEIIRVIDNGTGISQDKLGNIFEPYFTTKKETGGTGLGLYITQKVVAAHHGTIKLANNPNGNGGVTATLTLPLAE